MKLNKILNIASIVPIIGVMATTFVSCDNANNTSYWCNFFSVKNNKLNSDNNGKTKFVINISPDFFEKVLDRSGELFIKFLDKNGEDFPTSEEPFLYSHSWDKKSSSIDVSLSLLSAFCEGQSGEIDFQIYISYSYDEDHVRKECKQIINDMSISYQKSFWNDSWQNVIKYSNIGLEELQQQYNLDSFIGLEKQIKYGPELLWVRVIDQLVDEYITPSGTKKASLTFQFMNTPAHGYIEHITGARSLGIRYCPKGGDDNQNHLSSSLLLPALNSTTYDEQIMWYQLGTSSDREATWYRGRSVFYQFLPSFLTSDSGIKPIKRAVVEGTLGLTTTTYELYNFESKLALPTFADYFTNEQIQDATLFNDKGQEVEYKNQYVRERGSGRTKPYAYYESALQNAQLASDKSIPQLHIGDDEPYWIFSADFSAHFHSATGTHMNFVWCWDDGTDKFKSYPVYSGGSIGPSYKGLLPIFAI